MEFWEGAVLVVGGIWLVGHMSRRSASHPINQVQPTYSSTVPTLAQTTNTAGTPSLVSGETLVQPAPTPPVKINPVVLPPARSMLIKARYPVV